MRQCSTCGADLGTAPLPACPFCREPIVASSLGRFRAADIVDAIDRVSPFASRDAARPELGGVFAACDGRRLMMAATDGVRIAHYVLPPGGEIVRAPGGVVPYATLVELRQRIAQAETVDLRVEPRLFEARSGDTHFRLELPSVAFPNLNQAIPKQFVARATVASADVLFALASLAPEGSVRLSVVPPGFEIIGATSGHSQRLRCHLTGGAVQARINAAFLTDALRCVDSTLVHVSFAGPLAPVLIAPESDRELVVILMPMQP